MQRLVPFFLAVLAVLGVFFLSPEASAQDVNLFPLRVVFDDRGRSAEVTVFNRGERPGTYRIELSDRRMTPEGRLIEFNPENPKPANWPSAVDLIRFSPRQVTLAPGQSQSIRIALRRPANLAPGEYRSHLTVTAVPPADSGETIEEAARQGSNAIRIRITPIYGISIPIIVRAGEPVSTARLVNPRVVRGDDGRRFVEVEVQRAGAASVYGDLVVMRGDRRVGLIRGIGVYPEISQRTARIPLNEEAMAAARGPGVVRYTESSERENATLLAAIEGPAF
jgi:hypothetical protein